jgi:hypothetical protein
VSYSLVVFTSIAIILLLALAWLTFSKITRKTDADSRLRPEREWRHISYVPQIKQALGPSDAEYLASRGSPRLLKRVQKERRRIARDYLAALRTDFEKLVHFAQLVSALSPELDAAQELQGLRLRSEFWLRYQLIRLRLVWDIRPLEAISRLSDLVSGWTVRMEEAVSELGERAALLGEFTLPYNGGRDAR